MSDSEFIGMEDQEPGQASKEFDDKPVKTPSFSTPDSNGGDGDSAGGDAGTGTTSGGGGVSDGGGSTGTGGGASQGGGTGN